MANTLYGGPTGSSMIIKASYPSVAAMERAFAQGPSYTLCGYGEYCIIDTHNKNDEENGLIFQRGVNYTDGHGGAIRLGQIVGPSSGTPYFQLASVQTVNEIAKKKITDAENNNYTGYVRYPTALNPDGTYQTTSLTSDEIINGANVPEIFIDAFGDEEAERTSLIPGYNHETEEYRDAIRYTWCNIRLDNADADSWFYVGFELPYLVTDYTTTPIPPYDENGDLLDRVLIEKNPEQVSKKEVVVNGEIKTTEEWLHPFYNKWDMYIPKGIKGDCLRNLRVVDAAHLPENHPTIYLWEAFDTPKEKGYQLTLVDETKIYQCSHGDSEDETQHRDILVFDILAYDNRADASDKTYCIYFGNYNMVENISFSDEGKLTIKYTHDDNAKNIDGEEFPLIKWIDDITVDGANGECIITYNHPVEGRKTLGGRTLTDNQQGFQLDWITDILINEENGDIGFEHADNAKNIDDIVDGRKGVLTNAKLKLLTKADVDDTGIVTLYYNTGDSNTVKDANDNTKDYHLRIIEDSKINKGILEDKRIQLEFNSELTTNTDNAERIGTSDFYYIGSPINSIAKTYVRPYDWHLFILYSDPKQRFDPYPADDTAIGDGVQWEDINNQTTQIPSMSDPRVNWVRRKYNNELGIYTYYLKDGSMWAKGVTPYTDYDGNIYNDLFWEDKGTVKDEAGLLIGLNVTRQEILDYANQVGSAGNPIVINGEPNVINYLNAVFPNGLTGMANRPNNYPVTGKIVTYASSDDEEKRFYAFDYGHQSNPPYDANGWYYLGTLSKSIERDIVYYPMDWVSPIEPSLSELIKHNMVPQNGIGLYSRPTYVSPEDIPKYWDPMYKEN